jgi:uncharacterized protein (TIGR00369 family)
MASTNLDLVRSIFATWERGDYSSAEWAHPEIEFVIAEGPAPGSWTGLAGVAASVRDGLSGWEEFRIEAEEYRELDVERVLVLQHFSGRGKKSGLEVGQMRAKGAHLFHVRGGKVTRVVFYWDRERALADLGLAPQAGDPNSANRMEDHWRRLERMYHCAPVNEYFEPRLEVSEGKARIVMPVKPSSFHGGGALHGSVFFKMLDDACAFAVYSAELEVFVPTTSFTVNFLRPVTAGVLEATAKVVGRSGSLYVAEATLRCEDELVATGSGTFTRSRMLLSAVPGYEQPPGA